MIVPVAQVVDSTEAEGPGRRFALWFQGCPLRCPGCCNPEMLPFTGGTAMRIEEVRDRLARAVQDYGVGGVSLLGGEPVAHSAAASAMADEAHRLNADVMVYSGFTLEQIRERAVSDPDVARFLERIDILVDGPYLREQPEPLAPEGRRWIGSTNQQVHFLTPRGRAVRDDPRWHSGNTLEIRLRDGELSVNGFPARSAIGLWKRPRSRRGGSGR